MSGGKSTGTVPKTKHNTRTRRENPVNHIPNNLEWHPEYRPRRMRKESNNYAFHLPDTAEDFTYESSWTSGLGPSNRTDDDELRWSSVKSSNIIPERGGIENHPGGNRIKHPENHVVDDRLMPESFKSQLARGRLKVKMEQSEKKIEELQHQQAALMTLRHKAIQQVKPVQMEEIHQSPLPMRNKAIQQVKPVQVESEKIAKLNERIDDHMMQLLQAMENGIEPPTDQQVRNKLNELMAKKAQCDKLLCCLESDNVPDLDVPASPSSEEAENDRNDFHENEVSLGAVGGEVEEHHQNNENRVQWTGNVTSSKREAEKKDNREFDNMTAISAFIENKEMKLEEVRSKFEQLQTLMAHMEKLRDLKLNQRSSHSEVLNGGSQLEALQPSQGKNCSQNSLVEKVHSKNVEMGMEGRQMNSHSVIPPTAEVPVGYHNMFASSSDAWGGAASWNGPSPTRNCLESSSDEGEVEYDESPVKLCSSVLHPPPSFPKFRQGVELINHANASSFKQPTSSVPIQNQNCSEFRVRQRVQQDESHSCPSSSTLAYQINQLQMQMEQMYSMTQSMMEKQVPVFNQPWMPPPSIPHPSYLHYLSGPGPQFHQHQILVNSLNQCCQLIWHQQKELSALRQALAMLQDESYAYKCGGYGNNLNFESGLLWAQTSPQMLNNQVPPGSRANNYWDNFRSYSRQNLLSGRNKSNDGSIVDSTTVVAPPGVVPQQQPSTTHTENNNLQINRKDNCLSDNATHVNFNMSRGQQEVPNPRNNWNFTRRPQRSFNTSGTNADSSSVFSLEQSIYSELETVMAERNPSNLLQLLSHLKILRSPQSCSFEGMPNQRIDCCEPTEQSLPNFMNGSQQSLTTPSHPPPQPMMNSQNPDKSFTQYCQQDDLMSKTLGEVSKIIESTECDVCTPEFLEQLVNFLTERVNPQAIPKLEASLLKFQGTSLDQVGHILLCDIAAIIWSNVSEPKEPIDGSHRMQDPAVEEGAVGGIITPAHPPTAPPHPQNILHQNHQNVDTELAEADQPQHSASNNAEAFWGNDDSNVPALEMDNQELPPQDENEQTLQDSWSPGQGL